MPRFFRALLAISALSLGAPVPVAGQPARPAAPAKPAPANPAPAAKAAGEAAIATAPAGGGQPALSVAFDADGHLRAAVCPRGPCRLEGAVRVEVPEPARARVSAAKLRVVRIGAERSAVIATVPDRDRLRNWEAVLAAPPGGAAAKVVFSGWTGFFEGVEGERSGPMVVAASGGVYVGRQRENRDLCGRPAMLSPDVLEPQTLSLKPAKLMRLSETERDKAPRLRAARVESQPGPPLLTASWATSAATGSAPASLTDGNAKTFWAENRGGVGRGEFVVMLSPQELPISGFELMVRPPEGAEQGASPREVWVATDRQVFHVTLPEDGWRHPGARYAVQLEAPVRTACVALIVESAFDEGREARVTVAEFGARTELDQRRLPDLVASLRGGGAQAEAAGAVLRRGGEPAFGAVAAAYAALDEAGQRIALDVLDHAPCMQSLPAYVDALTGPYEAHQHHAHERIRDCGAASADALARAIATGPKRARARLAEELAFVAPAATVKTLVPKLAKAGAETRRAYRIALGFASRSPAAKPEIEKALRDPNLAPLAAIDLLRALGPRVRDFGALTSPLFARLTANASFRTRYLLVGVASELDDSDSSARAFLRRALVVEDSPHVRAQAARVATDTTAYQSELVRALADPSVRVREAAVTTLGAGRADFAAAPISSRLREDPWPLVRAAAARAVAQLGSSADLDAALVEALADASVHVRRPAVFALGVRRATDRAVAVRERLEDREEDASVRAAAATALGMMCHAGSVDVLTEYAKKLANAHADPSDRVIGKSALGALSSIGPSDLSARLEPLRARDAHPGVRSAAEAALKSRGRCAKESAGKRKS